MKPMLMMGSSLAVFALTAVVRTNELQAQRPISPPLMISSFVGADLYQFYCASCHGPGGKGDGPVALSLKALPPDLTTIAMRHDGHFPAEELQRYIAGDHEPPSAHGSREMPVWGPIFRSLEPHDRLTPVRIENLVRYIETLQKPAR